METRFDQRRNNIDFLRLALAVLVIFSHAFPLGLGHERTEPFSVITRGQVTGGHVAVDTFFILSGFLITASYERSRSAWSFLKKRIARIYPAFLVCALLAYLVVAPWSGAHLRRDGLGVLQAIGNTLRLREFDYAHAFAQNPYPDAINGSLWSISYEFWCYIGVLLLGLTGLLRRRSTLAVVFAVSIVISLLFAHYGWRPGGSYLGVVLGYPPFWARLLPMYLAGVLFYRYREHFPVTWLRVGLSIGALAAACVLPLGYSLLFPIFGTYLVFCFCFQSRIRLHGVTRYGDVSYGAYLYAYPVEQLVMQSVGHPCSPLRLFATATPITLALAAGSWYLVERPSLAAGHRDADKAPGRPKAIPIREADAEPVSVPAPPDTSLSPELQHTRIPRR